MKEFKKMKNNKTELIPVMSGQVVRSLECSLAKDAHMFGSTTVQTENQL
jgi:hypothetical protein